MSRIRDALRRAEQEKGRAPSASPRGIAAEPATPAPADSPAAGKPSSSSSGAAIAAASAVSAPASAASPRSPAHSSIAGLLEACRRPLWLGDANKLLFLRTGSHTIATEQLRNLRTRLVEMRARRALKTVAISSPMPSEGKTFLAANLAHALARQHDRKILLVDGDLRRSGLHTLLGAPAEPGLSDYLRGAASEEQILQRGPQENLFFIPAGKVAANPGELLSGGKVKKLVERLAPLFDWILVDTPAVADPERRIAALPAARLIAQGCDGVLLVIHSGTTPREIAQAAVREFSRDRLLGVVLNHAAIS